ncbi:hypothetical protein predicted by Glimmer/Critica [Sorangium cellulosum So ce56]|uniref:Uncharacterized protein n=1 Tax=Sorangium cellulosum (strain So ce56) TaxID=448385 RepID=A9FTL0_SORC5|nr:hypothetical protein predicted by Glimmer/Critica [Sorangium cellulosum So ce56]
MLPPKIRSSDNAAATFALPSDSSSIGRTPWSAEPGVGRASYAEASALMSATSSTCLGAPLVTERTIARNASDQNTPTSAAEVALERPAAPRSGERRSFGS